MNMFSSNKAWQVKSARLTKRWAFGYCSAFHLGKVDLWQAFIYECAGSFKSLCSCTFELLPFLGNFLLLTWAGLFCLLLG